MDPASLGLGAASLSFQLLEGAIKAFHYFDSAANAEKDCAYLKVQLHFEYSSLLRWGHESGLLKESVEPRFDARIEHQKMVIIAILSQLKLSLRDLRRLCLRHRLGEKQSDGVPEGLQSALDLARTGVKDLSEPTVQKTQKADDVHSNTNTQILSQAEWERYKVVLDTGEQVRTARVHAKGTNHIRSWAGGFSIGVKKVVTEPKRFLWATVDKASFQGLLDRVKSLVANLLRTLTQDQMVEVLQVVQEIRLLLLSVTKTKEGMQALKVDDSTIASLSGSTLVEHQSFGKANPESLPEESVQAEIQFNIFYSQAVNFFIDVKSHVGLARKPLDPVTNKIVEYADQPTEHDSRTMIQFAGEPAWIEWKPYDAEVWWDRELSISDTRAPAKAKESAELLSALLSFPRKPQEFCLPPFQGMFDDTMQSRFGFVFKEPPESKNNSLGVTLHSRLLEPSPPLHERVELAQQLSQWLLYLHSVTWLHKSISSTSIMFFPVEGGGYSQAYIGGFEYARLVQSGTTGGDSDLKRALYTHPKYLPGITSGFRQTYDMYALGIVLIELAFWQPVRQIFGFGESGYHEELKLPAILDAHEALMHPGSTVLKQVERLMGKRYTSAARACIQGMPAFGLPEGKDQAEPLISGLLQQAFIRVVVGPLKTIAV